MSEQQTYDVAIIAHQHLNSDKVSAEELQLISAFFPQILQEMIQLIDIEQE